MSLSRCIYWVATAVGLAIPLVSLLVFPPVSSLAVAAKGEVRAAGAASARVRGALHGPQMAQLGRSGGGSSAPIRPSSGPPPSPVTPSTPVPPSQLGSPAGQAPAIAPLSSQQQTQFATGSGRPGNLALSPGSSQGSPSEQAVSAPGGGGKGLEACMGFWEKATHMTKSEWRQACKRTIQEYPSVR